MIDEFSQQIENLESLCSELKYKITQKDQMLEKLQKKTQTDKKEIDLLHRQILDYKTNYILLSDHDLLQNQMVTELKDRDARIAEYEAELKENLYDSSKISQYK